MPDERTAKLETRQDNTDDSLSELKIMIADLTGSVHEINEKMARMGGFISGIAFVFSLAGAAVVAAIDYAIRKMT